MFNLAIDSKLRGCDVVAIRVEDVAARGYTADRATVRQKKTGRPVRFELSEQTRQAIDDYLKAANKRPGEFFSQGRCGANASMTTRQYPRFAGRIRIGAKGERQFKRCTRIATNAGDVLALCRGEPI
jgi:integrase